MAVKTFSTNFRGLQEIRGEKPTETAVTKIAKTGFFSESRVVPESMGLDDQDQLHTDRDDPAAMLQIQSPISSERESIKGRQVINWTSYMMGFEKNGFQIRPQLTNDIRCWRIRMPILVKGQH